MLTETRIAQFRETLLDELDRLAVEQQAGAEDRGTVELDQSSVGRLSRMDAMQRQAMAQAAARRRATRRARISAALQRMDDEEFGACTECGEEIDTARLSVDPTIPTCLSCARG